MNPIFYFLVALTFILAATANASGPVLDINGEPIFHGSYYAVSIIWGAGGGGLTLVPRGGGLTLVPRGGNQCPLYIGQEGSDFQNGIPLKFSNWRSRVGFVPESENLNINMDVESTICGQSAYWWVEEANEESSTRFIVAGPKPEQDSSRSFFQIKKNEGGAVTGYKIVFCPNDDCVDVGVFMDKHGFRRLGLSSTPFQVLFKKATGTETSAKTMSII